MIRAVHTIKKSPSCKSQQPKPSIFRERSHSTQAEEGSLQGEPSPLMQCSLMDLPGRPPLQPKVAAGEQQTTGIAEKSASPVIQRYVKVGLYEGSFGLDHIGVGVNSEKTLGLSPKEGLGREAEKGSWVDGEVKEDHGLLDSLTIRTNPRQEARLQAALNRAESSPQKFNLRQHNCSQHGAEILKSAGLNAKSSPVPRAFFEGLKKQYASKQRQAAADGQPVQGKFVSNAPATAEMGTRPNRTGMPDRLKSGIESLSGMDMSDVRVHPNSELPTRLDALAYTQGNQIYLGPGEDRHLPHEAWHVVQQKQGRVRATRQMKGVGVNDDGDLETEADRMSHKAMRGVTLDVAGEDENVAHGLGNIENQKENIDQFFRFKGDIGLERDAEVMSNTILQRKRSAKSVLQFSMHLYESAALSKLASQFAVQRKLIIGEEKHRLTQYNFENWCLDSKGRYYKEWNDLSNDEKIIVKDKIFDATEYKVSFLRDALNPNDREGHESSSVTPKTSKFKGVDCTVLNDSGGYHIILQHPNAPDLIIRERKSSDATSTQEGIKNMKLLADRLKRLVGDDVRVPHAMRIDEAAYVVEKVTGVVDGLALWNRLKIVGKQSSEGQILVKRLNAIAILFQENIKAAYNGREEPFPDFRPANMGVKEGTSELIYIDFDQRGEVKDLESLKGQALEWAGRRYKQDPGGARVEDMEFFNFITGGSLDSIPQLLAPGCAI